MRVYLDPPEASGEILRLALPRMARHPAGCHPVAYTLWYEYLAGGDAALKRAMDELLRERGALDNESAHALYADHIAGPDAAALARERGALERLMAEVSRDAANTAERADAYHDALGRIGERLRAASDAGALGGVVRALLEETQRMRASVEALRGRLADAAREIEALRAELARARGEAETDPLTGLFNRRGLELALGRLEADAGPGLAGASLVVLDIDHFKRCNDTWGHVFGDEVLRQVARAISVHARAQDIAARIGGEEFAILLPATPLEGARAFAERLRATIAAGRIRRKGERESAGTVTVSLGVAAHRAGESFPALLARADMALYEAKRSGRNRVQVFGGAQPAADASAATA